MEKKLALVYSNLLLVLICALCLIAMDIGYLCCVIQCCPVLQMLRVSTKNKVHHYHYHYIIIITFYHRSVVQRSLVAYT